MFVKENPDRKKKKNQLFHYGLLIRLFMWLQTRFQHTTCLNQLDIKSWRQSFDSRRYSRAVLMDLSKAFDTINHELLIAKRHTYGFNKESVELILDYLSNRWQRQRLVIISVFGLNCYWVFHKVLF